MASKTVQITLNDQQFEARPGDVLLNAALNQGIEFPHDCRVGHCGSCVTRVTSGITRGGEAGTRGMIKACQARVFTDLVLAIEETPPAMRLRGIVSDIHEIADGIVEVSVTPFAKLTYFPGQYVRLTFRGFPARSFSPTACMVSGRFGYSLKFHIKKVRGGKVTPLLGSEIMPPHPVTIEGPFGMAFHRPAKTGRLVLVGSGTGFAPVWAVAAAALHEDPEREMVLLAGSNQLASFYMTDAMAFAARHPNVTIIPTIRDLDPGARIVKRGDPADHLPDISDSDIVYAAGSPRMVDRIALQAEQAGAEFHADPFESSVASAATGQEFLGTLLGRTRKAG